MRWAMSKNVKLVCVFATKQDPLYANFLSKGLFESALFVEDLEADDAAEKVIEAVNKAGLKVDSAFSPYEQMVPVVADVASKLGLASSSKEAFRTARDKHLARLAIAKHGLATPKSAICEDKAQLEAALTDVGVPMILKPSSGAGSAGVLRANSKEEAVAAFERISSELKKSDGLSFNPGVGDNKVLAEQLMIGDELDIDVLMWDGKAVFVKTVDNWPCEPPYFVETGSNHPSVLAPDVVAEIEKYAVDCLHACGFTMGAFHVEVFQTAEGPRLIEINARQGGGSLQDFYQEMFGVDFFANFFISTFNIPINPPLKTSDFVMADYSITVPKSGILQSLTIPEHKNLFRATTFAQPGAPVLGLDTDSSVPSWVGEILVKAPTMEECKASIKEILDGVKADIVEPQLASKAVAEASGEAAPEAPKETA